MKQYIECAHMVVGVMNSSTETISNDYFLRQLRELTVVVGGWVTLYHCLPNKSLKILQIAPHTLLFCTYILIKGLADRCKYIILDIRSEPRWHLAHHSLASLHSFNRVPTSQGSTCWRSFHSGVSSFLKIHRLGSHQLWNFSFRKHTNCSCTQNRIPTSTCMYWHYWWCGASASTERHHHCM